jgi:hypothetical protein
VELDPEIVQGFQELLGNAPAAPTPPQETKPATPRVSLSELIAMNDRFTRGKVASAALDGYPHHVRTVTTTGQPRTMAFSPDSATLAIGCAGDDICVASVPGFELPRIVRPSTSLNRSLLVDSVSFDPDGRALHAIWQTASKPLLPMGEVLPDPVRLTWATDTWRRTGDGAGVRLMVHAPGSGLGPLIVRGTDRSSEVELEGVRFLDGRGFSLGMIRSAALSRSYTAAVDNLGVLYVWRTEDGQLVRTINTGLAGPVCFTADGERLVHTQRHGLEFSVAFTDVASGTFTSTFPLARSTEWAFHRSGLLFHRAPGESSGRLVSTAGDAATREVLWRSAGGFHPAAPVFSEYARFLAFPVSDSAVEVWELFPASPGA